MSNNFTKSNNFTRSNKKENSNIYIAIHIKKCNFNSTKLFLHFGVTAIIFTILEAVSVGKNIIGASIMPNNYVAI